MVLESPLHSPTPQNKAFPLFLWKWGGQQLQGASDSSPPHTWGTSQRMHLVLETPGMALLPLQPRLLATGTSEPKTKVGEQLPRLWR